MSKKGKVPSQPPLFKLVPMGDGARFSPDVELKPLGKVTQVRSMTRNTYRKYFPAP